MSCKTICVAGAKGGTGKTTVALSLAAVRSEPAEVLFIDADVEEPNAALFLRPAWSDIREIFRKIPVVDESLCDGCGKCADACAFGAILMLGSTPVISPESCHSCGVCALLCPPGAIRETDAILGTVSRGAAGKMRIVSGELMVGNASGVPLVKAEKDLPFPGGTRIIDSPPGTGCGVVEAVRGCDFCVLVTEPTPFGLHDLKAAVRLLRAMDIPFGVVVNRAGLGDDKTDDFCRVENIPLLGTIPYDRRIAEVYAGGEIPVKALPELAPLFDGIWERIGEFSR